MIRKRHLLPRALRLIAIALLLRVTLAAAVDIEVMHTLRDPAAAAELERLAATYTKHGRNARVTVSSLGDGGLESHRPHLVLLEDDDDFDKVFQGRRIVPIQRLLASAGRPIRRDDLFSGLRGAVMSRNGEVQSLPLAYSLPVLYVNLDFLQRAGIEMTAVPRTWAKLQELAGELSDRKVACPYTSSWPVWVHLENTASQHAEPLASGRGAALRLRYNSLVHVKHLGLMSSWVQSRYMHVFGVSNEADERFLAGECAMLTTGSSLHARLRREKPFSVMTGELPHYEDVYGVRPGRFVAAGGSLWALAGYPRSVEREAGRFAAYLASSEAQLEWTDATGYLPLSRAAGQVDVAGLGKSANVLLAPALSEERPLASERELLGERYGRLREILNEALAEIWFRHTSPKQALDTAVVRGNSVLNGPTSSGRR